LKTFGVTKVSFMCLIYLEYGHMETGFSQG
jgi:hypothetical protein